MLKRHLTLQTRQTMLKTLLIGSALTLLTACGGKSLNTKNAETFDASLKAMTSNMEEADRRKVAAAIMLLTDSGDVSTMTLSAVQSAQNQAGGLLSNDGDTFFASRKDILGEMILSADGRLNGKSAKDLIGNFNEASKNGIALELKNLNEALEKITADEARIATRKTEIQDKKTTLKAKEKGLIAQGLKYGGDFKIARLKVTTHSGLVGHGHATFKNINDFPVTQPYAVIQATRKDNKNITGTSRILNAGYDKNSRAVIQPGKSVTFRYDFGVRVSTPEGTTFSTNSDDYNLTARLTAVRKTDKSVVSFGLENTESQYIKSVPNLLKRCESMLVNADKRREAIKNRKEALSNGKIDDLPRVSLHGNFAC